MKFLLMMSLMMTSSYALPLMPVDFMREDFGIFDILNGICGNLFNMEGKFDFKNEMKFDMMTQKWTENCSNVDSCQHGVDYHDNESDVICPSCFQSTGDQCGRWKGNCAEGMTCQYDVITQPEIGVCVPDGEMTSRRLGERCGDKIGSCDVTMRCMKEADPMTSYVSWWGVCVTEEKFRSRQVGQTCGPEVGECGDEDDDVICSDHLRSGQKICHRKSDEKETGSDATSGGGDYEIIVQFGGDGNLFNPDGFGTIVDLFDDSRKEENEKENLKISETNCDEDINNDNNKSNDNNNKFFSNGLKLAIDSSVNKVTSFDKEIDEIIENMTGN